MTLPQRKKPPKKRIPRYAGHLKWVRGFCCVVQGCLEPDIEAAHVSYGYPPGTPDAHKAGKGKKAHDKFTVSLCRKHHAEAHNIGHESFSKKHGLDLPKLAQEFAAKSPHRRKWESE